MASGIECRLTCGHTFMAGSPIPYLMDKVWCSRCDTPRRVRVIMEWHIKCEVCRYGRHCGASKTVALRSSIKHYRTTGHQVKINFPGKVDVTVGTDAATESSLLNLLDTGAPEEESSH